MDTSDPACRPGALRGRPPEHRATLHGLSAPVSGPDANQAADAGPCPDPSHRARLRQPMGVIADRREISRGIHRAILYEARIPRALGRRSAAPVETDLRGGRRFPEPVEVGANYVVSERLANTAGHALASVVDVEAEASAGMLPAGVRDDSIGGADPVRGSGPVGPKDRTEALSGAISAARRRPSSFRPWPAVGVRKRAPTSARSYGRARPAHRPPRTVAGPVRLDLSAPTDTSESGDVGVKVNRAREWFQACRSSS
jgi:hypothetical protein